MRQGNHNHCFAEGDAVVGTWTVIVSDGLLSIPLKSTEVTKYEYVWPAPTVLSVYLVPEMILLVKLTGLLNDDARYTLYPATGVLLAVQLRVTEWGLTDSFRSWPYQLRSFPHPVKNDNAKKENR